MAIMFSVSEPAAQHYNFAEANEACALCLPLAGAWPTATHAFTNTSRSWPRGNYADGMCSHSYGVFSSAHIPRSSSYVSKPGGPALQEAQTEIYTNACDWNQV